MSKIRRTAATTPAAARSMTLAAASLALGACSLSAERPPEPTVVEAPSTVRYAVEPGDRLSLIAREFTGDQELWRTLAELNGIDDPRRLAVGQVLDIPLALIPEAMPIKHTRCGSGVNKRGIQLSCCCHGNEAAVPLSM